MSTDETKDTQIIPLKKNRSCAGKTIPAHVAKQQNKQRNKRTAEIKVPDIKEIQNEEHNVQKEEIKEEIPKQENIIEPKKKKIGRPKKEGTLRGMNYYHEKQNDILKQKKDYYKRNTDKRLEYQREWYLKKKQEEYKKEHGDSLDGFKIRQHKKSEIKKNPESIEK